jgi:hypothetical protein
LDPVSLTVRQVILEAASAVAFETSTLVSTLASAAGFTSSAAWSGKAATANPQPNTSARTLRFNMRALLVLQHGDAITIPACTPFLACGGRVYPSGPWM